MTRQAPRFLPRLITVRPGSIYAPVTGYQVRIGRKIVFTCATKHEAERHIAQLFATPRA